ncbi:hypothetical protein LZ575_03015 [Antarcticibacterium sp. 1MA-6-2]|uniref:hypothetical protein n=1 Tax=Antarcticibacterium sp. 1MA-6-2 TaxID=2908210 RepID=UPI001F1C78E4|nr:hypothetical protein [Antarcticibacterium sp. 1MA-6-2]UJH91673.1 hypothetical protein LZ575_03015 [Antarcticibacterium sp. 1MA-6-2]
MCTLITESKTNLYLRSCYYSGDKATWKDVIKEQLKEHLSTIGLEEGLVKSETRYFEVSPDKHLELERYEATIRDLTHKIQNFNK